MSFTIIPATVADLPAIRQLLVETWHATYDAIYGADEVDEISGRWHAIETLAKQLAKPDATFLLAKRGDKVVATSLAMLKHSDLVLLSRLYVRQGAQGRGVGHQLLDATLAPYPKTSVVRLEVDPHNAGAVGFYEHQGFVRAGEVKDCGGSSAIKALVYERRRAL